MRWAQVAIICVTVATLAGCGSNEDPRVRLRAEVRENPGAVQARVRLADLYMEDEAYHDAYVQYSAAWELDNTSFEAALGLARAQEKLNNIDAARKQVERALEISPDSSDALTLKGKLLLRVEKPKEAIDALSQAIEAEPDHEEALRYLPVAYLRDDQPAKAVEIGRAAVEQMPDDIDMYVNLAAALIAHGQPGEAETVLRKTMEVAPGAAEPPLRLAELLVQEENNLKEVIELADRSAEIDAGEGEAEAVAALALRKLGRDEEALRRLHTAAMANPRNVRLWLMLSAVYRDLGEEEAAARAAGMAYRFAPRRRVRTQDTGGTPAEVAPSEAAPAGQG